MLILIVSLCDILKVIRKEKKEAVVSFGTKKREFIITCCWWQHEYKSIIYVCVCVCIYVYIYAHTHTIYN